MSNTNSSIITKTVTQDVEDAYSDLAVFQKTNSTVTKVENIASRYISDINAVLWVVKEIGKNSDNEVCYVKTNRPVSVKPAWIPDTTQYNSL